MWLTFNKIDVLEKFLIEIFAEGVLFIVDWLALCFNVQTNKCEQFHSEEDKDDHVSGVNILCELAVTWRRIARGTFERFEYQQKNDWNQLDTDQEQWVFRIFTVSVQVLCRYVFKTGQ